jgi:hypothetical protein
MYDTYLKCRDRGDRRRPDGELTFVPELSWITSIVPPPGRIALPPTVVVAAIRVPLWTESYAAEPSRPGCRRLREWRPSRVRTTGAPPLPSSPCKQANSLTSDAPFGRTLRAALFLRLSVVLGVWW